MGGKRLRQAAWPCSLLPYHLPPPFLHPYHLFPHPIPNPLCCLIPAFLLPSHSLCDPPWATAAWSAVHTAAPSPNALLSLPLSCASGQQQCRSGGLIAWVKGSGINVSARDTAAVHAANSSPDTLLPRLLTSAAEGRSMDQGMQQQYGSGDRKAAGATVQSIHAAARSAAWPWPLTHTYKIAAGSKQQGWQQQQLWLWPWPWAEIKLGQSWSTST